MSNFLPTITAEWLADEQLHAIKATLLALVMAVSVAGCGVLPGVSSSNPSTATSCAVQSAEARPLKHPIVELAACIARTDDLSDPDRLFHETLGIKNDHNYGASKNVPWGISVAEGTAEHLPEGIRWFFFQRVDVEKLTIGGKRHFTIDVAPSKSCVTLADVVATFGDGYAVSPHPVIAPAPALPGATPAFPAKTGKFPGVYYLAPRLFKGPSNGRVHFEFDYYECANRINVQRDLGTND
jgi:hypothetical protein